MRLYQAGDAAAFERLYGLLEPLLRRRLAALARDPDRVRDLVQETFLQIHRARRTWDPTRPVLPWASAIARHVFLMERRAWARRLRREAAAARSAEAEPGGHGALARRTLDDLLAQLAPGRRRLLELHHLVGLSFREAGARLGIGEGAARVRASRALAELRRALDAPVRKAPR